MDGSQHREREEKMGKGQPASPRSQTTNLRGNERIVIMRVAPIQQNPPTNSSRRKKRQAKSRVRSD
jgi:hypothetical protein